MRVSHSENKILSLPLFGDCRPLLATSSELRKFMAYEDDGLNEFSAAARSAPNNAAHSSGNKIDKVFIGC